MGFSCVVAVLDGSWRVLDLVTKAIGSSDQ
jgi:hypothetical protein